MSFRIFLACATLLVGAASSASAQTVSLEFNDGHVNLVADNATVRMILGEWERLGGTRIVNRERVPGANISLELTGVTELQALEVLLRNVAGYVMTPRQSGAAGASTVGGIVILPSSTPPATAPPVMLGNSAPLPRPVPVYDEDPDERPGTRQTVNAPFLPAAGQPPVPAPAAAPPPVSRPSATVTTLPGTSRPGEITPPPPQPQPAQR